MRFLAASMLLLLASAWLGCGKARSSAHTQPALAHSASASASVSAVQSASAAPPAVEICADAGAPLRWLGSASNEGPGLRVNTPLALGAPEVTSAGVGCCAPWANRDTIWTALGQYGQITGTARVGKSELYYFTGCQELQLSSLSGTRGVDLWVASSAPFPAPPSAEWKPQAAEKAGLAALAKTLEGAMLPGAGRTDCDTRIAPLERRVLFYRSREPDDRTEYRVRDRAVIGGPLLIIAERDPARGGAWIASFVDTSDATACSPSQFRPKAVVDMNQDGVPEVVVHTDDGPIFGDLVYGYRQLGGWQVVARGVPGSTA
jgi:hypothetical protein